MTEELIESIADSLARIADALEFLTTDSNEMAETPIHSRPALYEALRNIAVNVDRT